MTPLRQVVWLTLGAALVYAVLRNLPDTHCAFLHAEHEPVMVEGVEFCGENEEANFYDPATLGFPFSLQIEPAADLTGGVLRVLDDSKRPVPPHLFGLSHTRQLHLHLRQVTGGDAYLHLHPVPRLDGTWTFSFPPEFARGFSGGRFDVYADFLHARSRRTVLLSGSVEWPLIHSDLSPSAGPIYRDIVGTLLAPDSLRQGTSVILSVRLGRRSGPEPLVLQPLMGALGHAVLVSEDGRRGYAHAHPSWTGREKGAAPELAFRLRLPPAGRYTLWVHVDDGGRERYAPVPLVIAE